MLAQAGSLPLPAETPVLGEQHGDPGEIQEVLLSPATQRSKKGMCQP